MFLLIIVLGVFNFHAPFVDEQSSNNDFAYLSLVVLCIQLEACVFLGDVIISI